MPDLYQYQLDAVDDMKNGCILCGGVGSGKSRTALAYYLLRECQGSIKINGKGQFKSMDKPRDLYIITTAKKRDSLEWEGELANFALCSDEEAPQANAYLVKVTIDSWNNIKKYRGVTKAFFIFDEQRVVGSGAWVKAFLDIARKNHWILLSATPGDTWSDYIPVFVANGFFKNKTEFNAKHCVFARFSKYPKIERYVYEDDLVSLRDSILVPMFDPRTTSRHDIEVRCEYDKVKYRKVMRDHWDVFENQPIEETGKWCYLLRKVVNSDSSRLAHLLDIFETHQRLIVFYNFNYELEMIKDFLTDSGRLELVFRISEWNGMRHDPLPKGEKWIYLVQYTAGCEGWNCIETNAIVFFSQNYSYKILEQASGRIDRINTPYSDLYYYHFRSLAPIDLAIRKAIREKRKFNESSFYKKGGF